MAGFETRAMTRLCFRTEVRARPASAAPFCFPLFPPRLLSSCPPPSSSSSTTTPRQPSHKTRHNAFSHSFNSNQVTLSHPPTPSLETSPTRSKMFASTLVFLGSTFAIASASLFPTAPVAATSCRGGQVCVRRRRKRRSSSYADSRCVGTANPMAE